MRESHTVFPRVREREHDDSRREYGWTERQTVINMLYSRRYRKDVVLNIRTKNAFTAVSTKDTRSFLSSPVLLAGRQR